MSQGRSSPQRTAGLTRRVAMLGVAVLAVVAVTLVALLIALYRLDDASTTAREDERAIAAALRVEGSVLEMSSAARGFLLGGNEAFLSSSEEARAALDPAIAELRAAVAARPRPTRPRRWRRASCSTATATPPSSSGRAPTWRPSGRP